MERRGLGIRGLGRYCLAMCMRESELLGHIARRSTDLTGQGGVLVGPGDDCAVLAFGGGVLLATVDHLVAGRHFDAASTPLDLVARKAVARSVSDIAAMGGTAMFGLATGCLPSGFSRGDELFDAMSGWARRFGCPLVGGDIAASDGPMVLTVTVLGRAHERRGAVLRSGARAGDAVYVSGRLGGSLASGRHLTFEPRAEEGRFLCDALGDSLHAMIDLSDGLGRDAGRVASASGVRVEFEAAALGACVGEDRVVLEAEEMIRAVSEGEDYELLFCVADGAAVPESCPATGTRFTRVGRIVSGAGCVLVCSGGEAVDIAESGWDHQT